MEEAIRKYKYSNEERKGKPEYHKTWKEKKNEESDQRNKGFKPFNFSNQQNKPSQLQKQPARVVGENPREPLQCWRCGGPHLCRNCPLENEYVRQDHKIQ